MTLAEQIEQSALVLILKERPDIGDPQAFADSLQTNLVYRGVMARKVDDGFVCTHLTQGAFPGAVTLSTFDLYHEDMNQADWDDEALCWKMPWYKNEEDPADTVYVWILALKGMPFMEGE